MHNHGLRLPEPLKLLQTHINGQANGWLGYEDGRYFFHYTSSHPQQARVSLLMPSSRTFWSSSALFPAFTNTLPEGALLQTLNALHGGTPPTALQLLYLAGHNGIGRIGFSNPDSPVLKPSYTIARNELLNSSDSRTLFYRWLPALIETGSGLAGHSPKLLISTRPGRPGTDSIIKIGPQHDPKRPQREHHALTQATQLGLLAATSELSADGQLLLLARFDTLPSGQRLAQEPLLTLLGQHRDHAPPISYEHMAQAIDAFSATPNRCLHRFFEQLIFHTRLGSPASIHKFAMLYGNSEQASLTPLHGLNPGALPPWHLPHPLYKRELLAHTPPGNNTRTYSEEALIDFGRTVCRIKNARDLCQRISPR